MKRFGAGRLCARYTRAYRASPAALQTWALQSSRPWMCVKADCRKVNYARAQQCEGCGTDKPVLTGWVCADCEGQNHKGVKFCRKCAAPASSSAEYWACASCHKNNLIDDLDDNSVCGHCEYDMAPKNRTEAEVLRIQQEISQRIKEQQLAYDTAPISGDFAESQGHNPWEQIPSSEGAGSASAPPTASETPAAPKAKRFDYKPFVYAEPPVAVSRLMKPKKPIVPVPEGPPGFDWMCRERQCGAMNKGTTNTCGQCTVQIVPAEWECDTCAAKNHWSRGMCFSCSTPITPSWLCNRCRTRTSIYDTGCRSCGSLRPPVEPVDPRDVKSGKFAKGKAKKTSADWTCEGCKAQNFSWRDRCFSCDMAKAPGGGGGDMWSDGSGGDSSPMAPVNDNNWVCDSCHASNFRTRTECWQCGKGAVYGAVAADDMAVPTFTKEGFQKGVEDAPALGLQKTWQAPSDDWVCGKCFAKNFKSKVECHKCGTTKTVAAVTRRITVRKPVKL